MSEQLTLWFDDKYESLRGDKRLEVLKHLDIVQLIPRKVYEQYYRDTGRPPYALESMLLALIAQKLLKIPTIELLITVLNISPLLRRYCGFYKGVPDESTFRRFKQRIDPEALKQILDEMARETNRLLEQEAPDPFAQKLLIDPIRLKAPVKKSNLKLFMTLKQKTVKGTGQA